MIGAEIDNLGIPPLAGVWSYDEATKIGYGVEEKVGLLRRYNYGETWLNQIAAAPNPRSTPEWEVKSALSLHLRLSPPPMITLAIITFVANWNGIA